MATGPQRLLDDDREDHGNRRDAEALQAAWPAEQWEQAQEFIGAFHQVRLPSAQVAARIVVGDRGEERSAREARILRVVEGANLGIAHPALVAGPQLIGGPSPRWAYLTTRVPGVPAEDLEECGAERLRHYARVLGELRSVDLERLSGLPEPRDWCGGRAWPELVRTRLAPRLDMEEAREAVRRAESVLEVEADAPAVFCHGDFGPHNLLWEGGAVASLIDLDHACVGDPAIDIAPLIGFHGASRIAELVPADELRRAAIHRASLPLQVAAAAHIAGLESMRDHALGNFRKRLALGTLFEPEGWVPYP